MFKVEKDIEASFDFKFLKEKGKRKQHQHKKEKKKLTQEEGKQIRGMTKNRIIEQSQSNL